MICTSSLRLVTVSIILAIGLFACSKPPSDDAAAGLDQPAANNLSDDSTSVINAIADRYYKETLQRTPETAYFAGVEIERHDGIYDNHPDALRVAEQSIDEMLQQIEAVDSDTLVGSTEWITYAYLSQQLKSLVAQRICRAEWWNVNQMGGWHSAYAQLAQLQPVGTPELRQQALKRWSKFDGFIQQEMANLNEGLQQGYSAPKVVVQRVIDQLDGILALEVETSPFYSPAARDNDQAFAAELRQLVSEQINPAMQSYRDYLANTYRANAREAISVTANPDGRACYEASLQGYTTLNRSGKQVYELGQQTVANNRDKIIELGQHIYALEDFESILDKAKNDPDDRFTSSEELLEFSRERVKAAEQEMPNWVSKMPEQPVEVVPFESHEEGTGRSAHYNPATPKRPGEYRIPLYQPGEQSRGNAEVTAFHETWPGHHLQVAVSQSAEGLHPVTQIIWFSGPGEGWARYSEALAEEMDLYKTTTGPITRRAWPARGMVVDPGIHLFGWTRAQAIDFMQESGRFPDQRADEMVDRIAILPGQLTAYDSGGLEIVALREQAEVALGDAFDIREFHDRVLENGTIPLTQLRAHIESWTASKKQE